MFPRCTFAFIRTSIARTLILSATLTLWSDALAQAAQPIRLAQAEATLIITQDSQAHDEALAKSKHTVVEHALQFGLTNRTCDSVLSAQQCFDFLLALEPPARPEFNIVSVASWAEALKQVDRNLNPRVSSDREPARWKAIRILAIQARNVVAKLNLAEEVQVPERQTPASLQRLKSELGVSHVEAIHRLLISGDRILVDHLLVDLSSGATLSKAPATELNPSEMSQSLGSHVANALIILGETAKVVSTK